MNAETILAIISAAQQLVDIAVREKALLDADKQADVDAALATLRSTSDTVHAQAQTV